MLKPPLRGSASPLPKLPWGHGANFSLVEVTLGRYSDPLMSPADITPCDVREILKERVRADLKVYADAVNALQRSMGKDFKKAQRDAERARLAFETASTKLAKHLASHRCG